MKSKQKLVSAVIVTSNRKKELIKCIDSLINQTYKNIQIIVVDNGSRPSVITWLPKQYPQVVLVTNDGNYGPSKGRNQGIKAATGEYILFMDDDAIADQRMVESLFNVLVKEKKAGAVQPLMYDKENKKILLGAGHDISVYTGRIKAWGVREEDIGQYNGVREVPMCGCVWMIKQTVIKKIGNFDEDYFIPYEDSDLCLRARRAGFKLFCTSDAKAYHPVYKKTFVNKNLEWIGITSKERAFRVARNKIIYMRKFSPFPANLFFFLVLLPLMVGVHSLIILSTFRLDVFLRYWMGVIAGVLFIFYYPIRDLRKYYRQYDRDLMPFKMFLLAWTDPIPFVIDKSAKTILDLACGEGKPMILIKLRMPIERAVGVDLFEPYIEQARKEKIHDEYILKDIRKVTFPARSFDIVLASHVLEHMPKKEAWKVLANMERMAKKQVVMATPIGEHYHPAVDGNELQIHLSHFEPADFEKKGYKVTKYGWKWLLGENGIVHRTQNDIFRKILFTFNILVTPIYYLFQGTCDYVFVAYKDVSKNK
jgi:GT2 family glycosyltransferase/ubiquinone/menaquinone biosynthesis C-methylase UbiE